MQFEDDRSNPDDENIEDILEDIVIAEDNSNDCFVKRDNTFFIIDCSPEIMKPLPGQKQSEFEKVLSSYTNFMMSKVIANCNDRVGLIFYNVSKKDNSLNFDNMCTVHTLQQPSAKMIRSVEGIKNDFMISYGHSDEAVPLHQVLWLFGQEIKDCDSFKNHVRLFLFTCQDTPHPEGDERREQTINHARQLAAKGACIELFPMRKSQRSRFDIRKFYQQIVAFDAEDLAATALDNSSKILNIQTRIRQKQYKKRTLNRLLMQVGKDAEIGFKIYSMYCKAKRPLGKKLQASTNKPLKRVVKRLNQNGQVLSNLQIGTYYCLGSERVILSKEDMNKIKALKKPGLTLIGFKPKRLIKPYHNIRASYFLYPDEQHVSGSTQFCDALIDELLQTEQVAIISIMPRANQQLRFAALFPQAEEYDPLDHHQSPPGFHMIYLPYSDDIVNFAGGDKTVVKPARVSPQLLRLTKLVVNNLTVKEFDFRDFENPGLQKFFSHLEAHALNETKVVEKPDTMQPDYDGFDKYSDVFTMCSETAVAEVEQEAPIDAMKKSRKNTGKKEQKKQQKHQDELYKSTQKKTNRKEKSRNKENTKGTSGLELQKKSKQNKSQVKRQQSFVISKVKSLFEDGCAFKVDKEEMSEYLKIHGLDCKGSRGELADRIMIYISEAFR